MYSWEALSRAALIAIRSGVECLGGRPTEMFLPLHQPLHLVDLRLPSIDINTSYQLASANTYKP